MLNFVLFLRVHALCPIHKGTPNVIEKPVLNNRMLEKNLFLILFWTVSVTSFFPFQILDLFWNSKLILTILQRKSFLEKSLCGLKFLELLYIL